MRATVISAACLILLASTSAQQRKQTTAAMPSGKTVLEACVSAWNRHDFAALDKLLTPDAVHEDIAWRDLLRRWLPKSQQFIDSP